MFRNLYQTLSKNEKRAFWVAIVMAIIFAVFAVTLLDTLINAPNLQYTFVNAVPFVLSFIAFVSGGLILNGRASTGSWLIQIGAIVLLAITVTQAEGYEFSSAFILLAVTLYVPLQILKGKKASTAFWMGIVGAVGIIILDTFWEGSRVPAVAQDTLSAGILSAILFLLLAITTITQFSGYAIRTKLLIFAMGTGLISIISVAAFTTIYTQRTLAQQARDVLVSSATHTMDDIDYFIAFRVLSISAEAQLPKVVTYLKASPDEQEKLHQDILAFFNELSQRDSDYISSYALLDRNGVDLVDTNSGDIGTNWSNRDYFLQPKSTGKTFLSLGGFSPTSSENVFYISAPVKDGSGETIGVVRVQFPFRYINEIFENNSGAAGKDSYAILLDEYNLILAHSSKPNWAFRTLIEPDPETYALFQNNNRIPGNIGAKEIALNMPNFAENLQTLSESKPSFTSTDEAWGAPVEVGVATSSTTPLKIVYVQPQSIALKAIDQQQKVTVIIALITGVIVLFAGFFVARTITEPIVNLAKVSEAIASGNLSARAQYLVQDEIGGLANSFNMMTRQLQDTLGGLERRVAERTADVELARLLSERRAQELQAISEISRTISTEQRLAILLPLVTRLVSEKFDFYHVGIFFVDDTQQFAVLQASNSEGGKRMINRGHRLEVGQTGIVGNVAQTGKPRIALDVGSDAVFFNNPDLPNTRSEMALPLNVRGRTIGILDVQSTKAGAFSESDANTLSILADQVAIAIENARLFGQSQDALSEVQKLYRQYQSQEWSVFAKQEIMIGYHQSLIGGKSLETPVKSDEIQAALQTGEVVVTDGNHEKSQPSLAIPVKLRGQTIGILNIKSPAKNHRWNRDEINLAQAVSDRLALALDNARLLQDSQRRAAKEAKIGEVTAKIGASINMRSVLQTAVEELGRALPGSEVVIQFKDADGEKSR